MTKTIFNNIMLIHHKNIRINLINTKKNFLKEIFDDQGYPPIKW